MRPVGPAVEHAAGTVRGRWEHGLAVFRGIPFAAPPVGRLRFGLLGRPSRGTEFETQATSDHRHRSQAW